jgi:hypothetical protein
MSEHSSHGRHRAPGIKHLSEPTAELVTLRPPQDPNTPADVGHIPSAAFASLRQPGLDANFPPIADHAFLSGSENTCLIAPTGTVEGLCLPRPHSPSVFGTALASCLADDSDGVSQAGEECFGFGEVAEDGGLVVHDEQGALLRVDGRSSIGHSVLRVVG